MGSNVVEIHFYYHAVEAVFYSEVIEVFLRSSSQGSITTSSYWDISAPVTFGGQYVGSMACVLCVKVKCPGITVLFRADSGMNLSSGICSRERYITHFSVYFHW